MEDANKQTNRRSARVGRFYHDGAIQIEADLTLDKQASHHLMTVLRSKAGDKVVLFNGDGYEYPATIINAAERGSSRQVVLHVHQKKTGIPESPLQVTLVQCVSKPERMDISLRQAVELGVNCIQPVYSRHSVKPGDEKRATKKSLHWQSIVISACEQSGRAVIPSLNDSLSYSQWVQQSQPHDKNNVIFVLDPLAKQSLTQAAREWHANTGHSNITLIIGPESGLDPKEINEAIVHGAQPVTLGPRILRTETAGPACIVLLQSLLGDL